MDCPRRLRRCVDYERERDARVVCWLCQGPKGLEMYEIPQLKSGNAGSTPVFGGTLLPSLLPPSSIVTAFFPVKTGRCVSNA